MSDFEDNEYPVIENWEIFGNKCFGVVWGSKNFNNGETIVTSIIKEHKEDMIRTSSGSIYRLGKKSKYAE